jgi:hypothetical protein
MQRDNGGDLDGQPLSAPKRVKRRRQIHATSVSADRYNASRQPLRHLSNDAATLGYRVAVGRAALFSLAMGYG